MERHLPVNVPKVLEALQMTELPPGRKYQKLSHLNRAEKALRRKLMNKQNSKLSRVRKREEVEELKEAIKELVTENTKLKAENEFLRLRMQPIKDDSLPKEKNGFVEIIDEGEQVPDPSGANETAKNSTEQVSINAASQGIHPCKEPSFVQMINDKPMVNFHNHLNKRNPGVMNIDFSLNGNYSRGFRSPKYNCSAHLSFGDVMGVCMGVTPSRGYQWNEIENVLTTNDSNYDWSENDLDDIDDLLEDLRPSFDSYSGYY